MATVLVKYKTPQIFMILLSLIYTVSYIVNLGIISVFCSITYPLIVIINSVLLIYSIALKHYTFSFFILFFILSIGSFIPFSLSLKATKPTNYTLLSYNTRGFNIDKQIKTHGVSVKITSFINSVKPDVLVLQESNYKACKAIKGYNYKFFGFRNNYKKSPMFTFSKFPIINTGYIDFPNTINNANFTDIKIDQDTIRIYNIHLESFKLNTLNYKLNFNRLSQMLNQIAATYNNQIFQAHLVKTHIEASPHPVIICGDFNATAFSIPYSVLKFNLKDAFNKKGHGFGHSYFLKDFFPLKLDHILLDKSFKVINFKNFKLNLSDHEPILTEFK